MSTRDDFSSAYNPSSTLGAAETASFTLATALSLAAVAVPREISSYLNVIIAISAIVYSAIYMIDDFHVWYQAESGRRKGAIENAFPVRLTPKETKGFYNNNANNPETKYALNLYESCYYTEAILRKMLPRIVAKITLAAIALAITTLYSDPAVVVISIQGVFSACVLFGCMGNIVCYSRVKRLNEIFFDIFITRQYDGNNIDTITLKATALEYEAVKAHYKVRLSSKVFEKSNHQLSQEWNEMLLKMNPSVI